MTVTVGIIIGVTLFFTICSIVLNRRSQDEDEFSLSVTKASWENGGRDLTSPMMGGGGEIEVVSSPGFQPLTPPLGSRMRPVEASSEAHPATPPPLPAMAPALISIESAPALPAIEDGPVEEGPALSEEIIRGLEQIPPLPKGVQAVLRELDSAGSSAQSVGDIVASDPVIGAVVLRVVNSAAVGLRRRVLTVKEAVTYLGFVQVRTLIMKLQVSQLFRAPAANTQCYDLDALWQHSMAVAQVADQLARRTGKADPDLASTLGLLHDIGKLAINCQFPQKVAQLWRPMGLVGVLNNASGESWLARERRLFGADHAFMGGFLAARWMLPEEITDGIRLHHPSSETSLDTVAEPLRRAIQIVHVANQLVKYRHCYCADMEIDTLDPALLSDLGLPVEMEQIFDEKIERAIAAAAAMAKPPAEGTGMRISA
ncbi:MAG: metal dependent phosphohydrolase [Phycisphaerales bacterium]|nr:metal dependent phosphohydrolase [Phycisphaerales bacterium]